MITIKVTGANGVAREMKDAVRITRQETKDMLHRIGAYGRNRAKAYIEDTGAVDLGELLGGTHYVYDESRTEQSVTIRPSDAADRYAIYVERGTRPHRPPVSALQGWADRHGIPVWAVVEKIAREGTEPRYMWRDAYEDTVQQTDNEMRRLTRGIGARI